MSNTDRLEGKFVVYVDTRGIARDALVTRDWRGGQEKGCINVAFCNMDENQTDDYGQKIARNSSVPHKDSQTAPGNYWMFRHEVEA